MDEVVPAAVRFGPRPAVFAVGGLLIAGAVVSVLIGRNAVDRLVAVVVLLGVAATLLAALRMRVRLEASSSGLVVRGLAGTRPFSWSQVHRVEVVQRRRLGAVSTSLELDVDDDDLLVFGRVDLGTDPAEVAEVLSGLRTGR